MENETLESKEREAFNTSTFFRNNARTRVNQLLIETLDEVSGKEKSPEMIKAIAELAKVSL